MQLQRTRNDKNTRLLRSYMNTIALYYKAFRIYVEPLVQPFFPRWSATRKRSRVQKIQRVGNGCVRLQLKTPRKWKGFQPGQFVELGIFKQGAELKRFFSISSSPEQYVQNGTIDLTIQIQKKGRVTPWIFDDLEPGKIVTLSKAKGDFIMDPRKPALMIAGGYGLTPFLSYLGTARKQQALLLHYCKTPKLFDVLFEPLDPKEYRRLNTLQRGRFSEEDLEQFCPNYRSYEIYLCGPGAMIEDLRRIFVELGCLETQIHVEHFVPQKLTKKEHADDCEPLSVYFEKSNRFMKGMKKPLLELAEDAGLRPQFGCRMGICDQCKCKKKSGVVYNKRTRSFSDSGPEEIKICVSVPVNHVILEL